MGTRILDDRFTPEELAIIRLLANGNKDEQIARRLYSSIRTVRRRIARIMAELDADNRFAAGVTAARLGLLDHLIGRECSSAPVSSRASLR
ncbi:response regulator transcription factor [Actinocrispum wychmicini]|uniref:Regulatory LuxR family protein n=1 Tax=Actinocrispum wychmicini TaxID=1213861 RepID=A0A4R2JT44_9PSEU|nr:LuxR C-terminal-related transcriptional regulator [Actinocrispum wychmicini]TCO62297.1 regulatory LuxR family protein [Actinocrispum wychmicini]